MSPTELAIEFCVCRLNGWWSNNRDIRLTNMGKGESCDVHVIV
jgi:hypothetical protein